MLKNFQGIFLKKMVLQEGSKLRARPLLLYGYFYAHQYKNHKSRPFVIRGGLKRAFLLRSTEDSTSCFPFFQKPQTSVNFTRKDSSVWLRAILETFCLIRHTPLWCKRQLSTVLKCSVCWRWPSAAAAAPSSTTWWHGEFVQLLLERGVICAPLLRLRLSAALRPLQAASLSGRVAARERLGASWFF